MSFQLLFCHTEIFVHNIGCPSKGCFVHVWCTIQTYVKFAHPFWCFGWAIKILYSNQKSVFSVSGFQSVSVFIFVLVSEIGKCYTQLDTPIPPFYKRGGGVVKISAKNGGGLDFYHKKGRVGKLEVSLIFILANLFQSHHSPSVWCTCVFCLFIPFLSVFFVFHGKNLSLMNLINRYMIATSE